MLIRMEALMKQPDQYAIDDTQSEFEAKDDGGLLALTDLLNHKNYAFTLICVVGVCDDRCSGARGGGDWF